MIVFVVLHYMAADETILCVESILKNIIGEKKVVIVDNASPNGSFNDIKNKFISNSDVTILKMERNLGFAKGNNYGYKYAIGMYNPDFIVVMNNDMEIMQSDFIDEVQKSFLKYRYYIMGPDIYSTKKRYHQNPNTNENVTERDIRRKYMICWIKNKLCFLFPVKWWFAHLLKKNRHNADNVKKQSYIQQVVINPLLHGSCYVFSSLFIAQHPNECFYDKTFMYMEAEILHYCALRDGEKMIYYPKVKINHHEDMATDLTYRKQYQKSIFTVKCMLQSTKAFLELIKKDKNFNLSRRN